MRLPDLDADVEAYILAVTRTTGETPSAMLRRIFELPGRNGGPRPSGPRTLIPKDGRHREIQEFVDSPRFRAGGVATKKYLSLLGFLYRQDPKGFEQVLELAGRHRKYFGRTKDEIAKSGKSLHPRQVPGAPFWAMTNADTDQKHDLIQRVLTVLGYDHTTAVKAAQAIV